MEIYMNDIPEYMNLWNGDYSIQAEADREYDSVIEELSDHDLYFKNEEQPEPEPTVIDTVEEITEMTEEEALEADIMIKNSDVTEEALSSNSTNTNKDKIYKTLTITEEAE